MNFLLSSCLSSCLLSLRTFTTLFSTHQNVAKPPAEKWLHQPNESAGRQSLFISCLSFSLVFLCVEVDLLRIQSFPLITRRNFAFVIKALRLKRFAVFCTRLQCWSVPVFVNNMSLKSALKKLNLAELQERCTALNLPSTGTKRCCSATFMNITRSQLHHQEITHPRWKTLVPPKTVNPWQQLRGRWPLMS